MSKWAKGSPHSSDIECDSLVQLPRLWDDEGVWNRVVARIRPENCLGHDFWNAKYKWSTMHNDVADEPGWRTVDCVDQFAPPPLLLEFLQLCERIVNRLTQLREILSSTNGPRRSSLKYKHKMKFGSNSCLTRVGLVSSWRPRHINVGHLWKWGEKWKKLEYLFILLISTQPRFLKWKFSAWVSQSKFSSWVSHIQKWGEVVIFWRLVRGGT